MKHFPFAALLAAALTIALSACASASAPAATPTPVPQWLGAALTDINTGKTFTIDDFKGKVVMVEDMAQWCTTCKAQQDQIKAMRAQLSSTADLVSVDLDIDPNEHADTLKTYTASHGYDWMYAVPSKDVAREIGNVYGAQFLNPPSAPMMIIDRQGVSHPLPFGVKSADSLMKALQPYLSAGA